MDSEEKNTLELSRTEKSTQTRKIIICGLMIAMSIVLGKLLAFNIGDSIRVSFENLPILMTGIFFGSWYGCAVGVCADIVGCMIAGYSINPFITVGGALIGFISGFVSNYIFKRSVKFHATACSVFSAHILGSMLVKSLGLYIYYNTPIKMLILRIPLYIGIGILETYIIYQLRQNKAFSEQLERVCKDNGRLQ